MKPSPDFHMLDEIFEQPDALARTLNRYVDDSGFRRAATAEAERWLSGVDSLLIVASGSSRHAGLAAELMFEEFSGIHVDVEYASEYIHSSKPAQHHSAMIVVSQSGETADTLAALRKGRASGKPTLAISNVPLSSMAQEADLSFPTEAGTELAIPATKSFTAQLLALWLLSLLAAKANGALSTSEVQRHLANARELPKLIAQQLSRWKTAIEEAAVMFEGVTGFLFLGRAVHYAIAREGALKLKESAYVTAEGYPGGELKHGPNALVSGSLPLVMIATADRTDASSVARYARTLQLMREMKGKGASILAIVCGDAPDLEEISTLAYLTLTILPTSEPLLAIQEVIPLQLFAYSMAVARHIDVDHPRHLVKAVLTE